MASLFHLLPFCLAAEVIGDNDGGYIAACINAGLIKGAA